MRIEQKRDAMKNGLGGDSLTLYGNRKTKDAPEIFKKRKVQLPTTKKGGRLTYEKRGGNRKKGKPGRYQRGTELKRGGGGKG